MSGCGCQSSRRTEFAAVEGAPIVCTIEKGGMAHRVDDFRRAFEQLIAAERFAEGFRWTFQNREGFEVFLRELAAREHECCQFVTFTIYSAGDCVIWETHGSPEAQGAIDVFFGLPKSAAGDLDEFRRSAAAAGLSIANDGALDRP